MSDTAADVAADEPGEDAPAAPEPVLVHGVPVTTSCGQAVAHPSAGQYVDLVKALHDDGYVMCVDLTAVDYLTYGADRGLPEGVEAERFEVVVSLLCFDPPQRIRLRVQVPEADPTLPTLYELHPGTEAPEREAFDMYGIRFDGHPDLTRILMPEDWQGHPLRKDEGKGRIPVQFKDAPAAR